MNFVTTRWTSAEIFTNPTHHSGFVKNRGIRPLCYFWRDNTGNEIDLLIEDGARLYPVEIKSGRTLHEDFFKNLQFFHKISGNPLEHGWVIYGGSEQQTRSYGNVAGSQSALL